MRQFLVAAALLLAACPFFGQAAHRQGQVFQRGNNVAANVVPFAQIQVCAAGTGGSTCGAASVYYDFALTMPITGPLTADSSGNYDYYLTGGCVDEVIASPGTDARVLPYVCLSPSAEGSGTVSNFSSGNLSPLFSTSVSNPSTTPVQSFALSATPNFTFYGNFSGATTTPSFWTLAAGSNVTLTPSGNTLTLSATGGSPFITSLTTTGNNGSAGVTSGALNIPHYTGVASPRTPGHCPEFDSNGIDLIDSGAVCGSGGGTPAGGSGDVQINQSGSFAVVPNGGFNYNNATQTLSLINQNSLQSSNIFLSPGWNFGSPGTGTSTGAVVNSTYGLTATFAGQGNHSVLNGISLFGNGNGDLNGVVLNGGYSANNIDGSAQGYTGFADQMVISPTKVYTANVASTGTPSGFPGVTLAVNTFNSGTFGTGRWLIDKTTGVLNFTATGVTTLGSGSNVYASVAETGQTFTPSIQGSLHAAVNGPTVPNPNNTPILASFTVTIASTCSVGDQFTIGGINTESAKIVSASFTGGVMTATAWLRASHESGAFFMCEGPTGRLIEQLGDETNGNRFLFVVLGAINSSTLAIAREIPNGMDAGFLINGSDRMYQGARIVDPRDPSTGLLTGNLTLAETTATFTASDALEVPNGTTQILSGRVLLNMLSNNPYLQGQTLDWGCPSGSTECGGLLPGQYISNFNNGNPTTAYTINGGRWGLRKVWGWSGPIGSLNYFATLPVAPMFEFQHTSGGSFNLWQGDDADFFETLGNNGTATTVTTHANNFVFTGPSGAPDTFSNTGSFNFAGTASPLLLNGSAGTSGQVVISAGPGATPTWGAGGGGGSGTVTSFAAPSGSWPTWLVPTVTSSTTTPSLAVAASSIPNAALANPATTVNGQTCTLGSTCLLPVTSYIYYPAAVCSGGVSFPAGLTTYDNNQPSPGCTLPASSTTAFLAFNQTPSAPQYAEATIVLPPFWTSSSITFQWYTSVTSGNAIWEIQTACPASGYAVGTPTFGTAQTVTSAAAGTAGNLVTATISNIAVSGTNGCPTASTTPGILIYRIFRSASDTVAANADLTGVTLATSRSQ